MDQRIKAFLESGIVPLYKTIEDLWRFCANHQKLYIYGVCKMSSGILEYLSIIGIDVEAYVVSDDRIGGYTKTIVDGKPILALAEVPISTQNGFILGLPEIYYNDAIYNLKMIGFNDFFIVREYDKLAISEKLKTHSTESFYFWVNIVDHCNLGCRMCLAFAQISDERFMDVEAFKQDMLKLRELSDGNYSGGIFITGGEPLLHPSLSDFISFSREIFPQASLSIFTNGIKLLHMSDSFWKSLCECNCSIVLTTYPVSLDYDAIRTKASLHQAEIYSASNLLDTTSSPEEKLMNKYPFDLRGEQQFGNFIACYPFNTCNTLKNGKLYSCSILPNVNIFNEYFGENMALCKEDYLDIHQANDFKELLNFVRKPPVFCRYCDVKHRRIIGSWSLSKKSIEEYVD